MIRKWTMIFLLIISNSIMLPLFSQVVVINEVCTSPSEGATGSSINANSLYNMNSSEQPPENREWIELYNPHPCNSLDISCYTLAGNMLQSDGTGSTPNWGAFTFPSGTVIPPLGFIIVGGNNSQVPLLDFNLTYYRLNTFGVQYLDGDETRWFLRDEYGWIALYDPAGNAVDAVYWNGYGNSSILYSQTEYSQNVVTTTTCSGTQSLAAARNISGIEFVGMIMAGTNVSFQRIMDGGPAWHSGPVTPTPRVCNGPCVEPPVLTAVVENESCAGNDGSISLTIQDGHSGPYTTNWLQPAGLHTNTLNNLSAGTYIVQVVDAYECFFVYDTITVIDDPAPTVNLNNIINESCSMSNGSVTAVVNNANPPVNYHWSIPGSGNTATVGNLPAGTYSVTITDNLGCTDTDTVTLVNFPGPEISIDSIHNEMCSSNDGAIFTSINGGSQPFSFVWNSSPVQTGQNLTGVQAGNYTVTITDAYSCTATANAVITNTPPPSVLLSNIRPDTCRKKTGAAEISVNGGNPPYNYSWSADSLNHSTSITNLSEGTYYVSVTDSLCTKVVSFVIPLIPGPKADFEVYPLVTTIDDPTFRFNNLSSGIIDHWLWNFLDHKYSDEINPYHSFTEVGHYHVTLTVTNNSGCIDSVSKEAIVIDRITLFVPNCFTPNGDGVNDYFIIAGQNITDFELFIYNRWGELVYKSTDINQYWDGRHKGVVVPEGVYGWVLNYSEDWAGLFFRPQSAKGIVTVIK